MRWIVVERSRIIQFGLSGADSCSIEGNSEMTLRLFVDKSSLEAFGDDGRFAMTNLVFPSEPYNRISFYAKGGSYAVSSFKVYKLK